jgi:hypothetical protein
VRDSISKVFDQKPEVVAVRRVFLNDEVAPALLFEFAQRMRRNIPRAAVAFNA